MAEIGELSKDFRCFNVFERLEPESEQLGL